MRYDEVRELKPGAFKRLTGVKPETFKVMVEALRAAAAEKRKSGRPSKRSVEDQLLLMRPLGRV